MNRNIFLKKLAKYDGTKYLKISLKKLAMPPLADELVEKGIPPMVRISPRELIELGPEAKKIIEDYFEGDIRKFHDLSYRASFDEEKWKRYLDALEKLSLDDHDSLSESEEDMEYRALSKFHQSPKYKSDSIKYFKDFPVPVYIIPVYQEQLTSYARAYFLSWQQALPILEQTGLNLDKIKEDLGMNKELSENDSSKKKGDQRGIVFLSKSLYLQADFWPTPWMLIHAFFDQSFEDNANFEDFYHDINRGYQNLLLGLYNLDDSYFPDTALASRRIVKEIANAITSKSGRPGGYLTRPQPSDQLNLLAEMLTQAIVTGQCTLNLESVKTPEAKERLKAIQDWVNGLGIRERLINKLEGKIVAVEVATVG